MADDTLVPQFSPDVHESLAALRQLARSVRSLAEWREKGRRATEAEIALALSQRKDSQCRGFSQRTSLPCSKAKCTGLDYCRKHSGAFPQMKALAERRLAALTSPALDALEHAIVQRENLLVSLKASQDVMDRNAIGASAPSRLRAAEKDRGRVIVNIGFLTAPHESPTTIVIPVKPDIES